jgi:lipopolysaccharide biosynthesis glycosyltransferase
VEGDYAPHSAAMLHSVLGARASLSVHVHYFHGPEMWAGSDRLITEMVEQAGATISFVSVPDERLAGLPTEGFTRKATWYRIFVPDLLPDVERILFLDADLIVLDSLEPLWATDVTDHYLAAVTNVFQDDHLHRPAQLGMDWPQEYFNAGVMLMNLERMRQDGCSKDLLDFGVDNAASLMFRDQDALNTVLGEQRLPLHPRWNCMNSTLKFPWAVYAFGAKALEEARSRPGIRHFEGPERNKPWHADSWSDMSEVYFEHRRHTPWPDVELQGDPQAAGRVRRTLGRVRRRFST